MTNPTPQKATIRLGMRLNPTQGFGFSPRQEQSPLGASLDYAGDAHLMTVAPTGKGKGVSAIIPTLLEYPGSVIVFDPKGENLQITARRRRELGQRVIALNPFNVLTEQSDSLNPLDLLQLEGADVESDAQMLGGMLAAENRGVKDPFWDLNACGVVSGLIAHYATWGEANDRTLNTLYEAFHKDDVIYSLAVLLDTAGKQMNQFAYREIAAFLQHPEQNTRGGVQSTAASYLKCLAGGSVPRVLGPSSFSLQDFVHGEPLSIYVIVPPGKLDSHRGLLRLLIATLLAAVMTRENRPEYPTLFLLDEAAQLRQFPLLEQAITLCRGYGLKVWSFWQDLAQLRTHYPLAWETLINNCDVKQIFGLSSMFMAREWARLLEHDPHDLLRLGEEEQLIVQPDGSELKARKLNYLTDAEFLPLADPNPRYSHVARVRRRPEIPDRFKQPNTPESSDEGNDPKPEL